jgi:hypothetical protein
MSDDEARRLAAEHGGWIEATITRLIAERERLHRALVAQRYDLPTYRQTAIELCRINGFAPGMWARWRDSPPPLPDDTAAAWRETMCVILDALTQEGVPAWSGDGTSCVQQVLMAQIAARRSEQARIIDLEGALMEYGQHTADCRYTAFAEPCDCGYTAVFNAIYVGRREQ